MRDGSVWCTERTSIGFSSEQPPTSTLFGDTSHWSGVSDEALSVLK